MGFFVEDPRTGLIEGYFAAKVDAKASAQDYEETLGRKMIIKESPEDSDRITDDRLIRMSKECKEARNKDRGD